MTSRRPTALLRLLGVSIAACAIAISGCGDASGTGDLWHNGGPDDPSGGDPGAGGGGSGSSSTSTNGATGGGSGGSGGSTAGGGSGDGTGSGSTGSGGETAKGAIAVALDKSSASMDLMTKSDFMVTVTPSQGFTGGLTLAATGLPTGATATFTPSTLDVTGAAPMTAKLEINVAASVTPTGGSPAQIAVTATPSVSGAAAPASATLALGVNAKISFFIPNNAPNQPNVFGVQSVTVNYATISSKTPLTVVITNLDASRDHIVHANGQNGFQHGDTGNPLGLNESMTRMVTGKGNYPFYLHDFSGTNPSTTLKIQ
jgi:hypothetical protein